MSITVAEASSNGTVSVLLFKETVLPVISCAKAFTYGAGITEGAVLAVSAAMHMIPTILFLIAFLLFFCIIV